jgi:hypothetical protein
MLISFAISRELTSDSGDFGEPILEFAFLSTKVAQSVLCSQERSLTIACGSDNLFHHLPASAIPLSTAVR